MTDLIADIVVAVIYRQGKAIKPLRIPQTLSKDERLAQNICRLKPQNASKVNDKKPQAAHEAHEAQSREM